MTRMFIRHKVNDYKIWRSAYENFEGERKAAGVTAQAVYQAADNPKDITVWHDFPTLSAAQGFASSDKLKQAMAGAGVTSKPEVWFTNPA